MYMYVNGILYRQYVVELLVLILFSGWEIDNVSYAWSIINVWYYSSMYIVHD